MKKFISLFVFSISSLMFTELAAQSKHDGKTLVTKAEYLGKSKPLRDLKEVKNWSADKIAERKKALPKKFFPNFRNREHIEFENPRALPAGKDPVWQSEGRNTNFIVEPIVNIDGINSNATPPDPTGVVGKDHYIQMVNATRFQVLEKDGTPVTGWTNMSAFWSQFGLNSGGDPIVLYDEAADRWYFTEFPSFQNVLLVAVSETGDPLGEWNAYRFNTPSFPDYPKYGLFNNALVVTTNEGGDLPLYCLDRQALLDGADDVTIVRMTMPRIGGGPGFQVTTPVNLMGTQTTQEGDPMIIRMNDDAWGLVDQDQIELWSVEVDFASPETASISLTSEIPTEAFDSNPCSALTGGFACIPQPNGQGIDGIPEVIMNHCQYRNFGGHESIVLNFIADASGNNLSGIRWMELRRVNCQEWFVYQEGTYAPDDNHRFMGGIAIDAFGNIGLGYNVSSLDKFASLAFTGRKKSDPLGMMTICEHETAEGNSNSGTRFGDYAQMTVDPVDGRTFWYTGEYMGPNGWRTRIFSFRIDLDSIDMAMANVTTPVSSSTLTDQEIVTVVVQNQGESTIDAFELSYVFNGNQVGPFSIDTTLEQGDSFEYVFAETIDVSESGNYELLTLINTSNDEFLSNDSLTHCFRTIAANDVGVIDLSPTDFQVCGDSTSIEVKIENFSDQPLMSAEINLNLNGTDLGNIPWTGNLAFGESQTILIPVLGLMDGSNDIVVTTSLPNGNADEITDNDQSSITLVALTNALSFTLELLTDFYPDETTWEITNDSGELVAAGGPYGETALFTETFCVDPEVCYTFTINDNYGDGLIGQGGNDIGNYQIINEQGQVVASLMQLNFGLQETNEFCGTFMCNLMADIDISPETSAGSMDGVINITPQNGIAPFEYSIDGGTTTSSDAMFTGLSGGTYDIFITDGNACTYETTVEVVSCDIAFTSESVDASNSNSLDGTISIEVLGGTPPFQYSSDGGFSFQSNNVFEGLPTGDYDVVVEDANGCRSEDVVELSSTVSVANTLSRTDIKIFPNPTNGLFSVEINSSILTQNFLEYELLDATGKLILNDRFAKYNDFYLGQISILTSPSGVYYLRIVDSRVQKMTKIVKE